MPSALGFSVAFLVLAELAGAGLLDTGTVTVALVAETATALGLVVVAAVAGVVGLTGTEDVGLVTVVAGCLAGDVEVEAGAGLLGLLGDKLEVAAVGLTCVDAAGLVVGLVTVEAVG